MASYFSNRSEVDLGWLTHLRSEVFFRFLSNKKSVLKLLEIHGGMIYSLHLREKNGVSCASGYIKVKRVIHELSC